MGAFALAVPLGLVAALNPCAFPLLPGYLALFARGGSAERSWPGAARTALVDGAAMTLAFVVVFCGVGAVESAVLGPLLAVAPEVLLGLGALLVASAIATLLGHAPRVPTPSNLPRGRGLAAATGFGAVYAAGSLGCALPLFLAATGDALAVDGWYGPVLACVGYALGMGLTVVAVGLLAAIAGAGAARRLGVASRTVVPIGVVLESLCGIGLAAVGLRDLGVPLPNGLLDAQAALSGFVDHDAAIVGTALGAVVLAGAIAVAVAATRAARAEPAE